MTKQHELIRFFSNKKNQLLFIVAIVFAFYGNSIGNDFATDDAEYYTSNQFVQQGINGIHDLFTKESMYGTFAHNSAVSGGRWRPLSLITFALEKQYFDANPHISHFINLLLLLITGIVMLLFLRKHIFISLPVAAFLVVVLFIIHPVHTEAVSHIKSRDELLSWLFLLLTLYCSLNFLAKKNYRQLLLALLFYFLGLLSKENGVTFIALLPLTFYFFTKEKLYSIIITTLPFIVVFGCYVFIRASIIPVIPHAGSDIVYASYLYATPVEHVATALMMLGKYVLLLFWPNPLSCDYSYNQVPYVNFSDWRVWLSVIAQAALVSYALLKIKEKSLVSYGILFYFFSIFIVSNLIVDVGTFLGERFLYQPSFGFCIAIVVAANELIKKIHLKKANMKISLVSAFIVIIILLSAFQTIERNAEWKDSRTVWSADIIKSPNSLLIHENLGYIYMNDGLHEQNPQQRDEDFVKAWYQDDSAINILPTYPITWFNMGYLYLLVDNKDSAKVAFIRSVKADSTYSQGYNGVGTIYYKEKDYPHALVYFNKGLQCDSTDAQFYFNIGLCYQKMEQYEKAIPYFEKTLSLLSNLQNVSKNRVSSQAVQQALITTQNLLLQNKH